MKEKCVLIFRLVENVTIVDVLVIMREIVQEDAEVVLEKDIIVEDDIGIVEVIQGVIVEEEDILDILNRRDQGLGESIEVIDIEEEKVVIVIREEVGIVEEVEIEVREEVMKVVMINCLIKERI